LTDVELGRALAPDESPSVQGVLVQALGERRRIYERLIETFDEIAAGFTPPGALVCHRRRPDA
jgi:hypothetical protein